MASSRSSSSLRQILAWSAALFSSAAAAYPRPGGGADRWHVLHHAREAALEYDYVVIGGGTAGLTVADRLTEDPNTTVLVIEYGALSDSALISTVQGGFRGFDAQFLYAIQSVPQTHLKNRTTGVLAGKVVGGSSAVNAMMTVRGTAEDYDRWGSFFEGSPDGDEEEERDNSKNGWSWTGLLPYFRKALHFAPPLPEVAQTAGIAYNTSFWGNTSSVYTGWPSFQFPGTTVQFDAFRSMPGVKFPVDSGAGEPGVYWFPSFMDPHSVTRSYARTGHHDRAMARNASNYHLLTRTKVDHIVLAHKGDGPDAKAIATGVRFTVNATASVLVPEDAQTNKNGNSSSSSTVPVTGWNATTRSHTQFVRARREVILAAGGIHSPQILQLSGVGPRRLLAAANISTIVDLPGVGQNFQDHPMLTASFALSNYSSVHPSASDLFLNATFRAWSDAEWKANRTGPQSLGVGNAAAWLPFPVISPRWSEVSGDLFSQKHAAYLPEGTDDTVAAGYAAQMTSYAAALRNNHTAFYNNVLSGGANSGTLVLLHPLSRGTVNIDPVDPHNREPLVDYRAMSNPLDGMIMADMIRYTRRFFMENPAYTTYGPVELAPGDYVNSDEDLVMYLSETITPSEYHPAGTCAMLPRALGGVVDQKLRVYGVDGLRVVDASIFPTLPGANTCQTVYAVAEKAADIIKAAAKSASK
ncbi:hypothetical protein SBRCBS47491_002275 [Sporothrix bragantina]|uniref:Choline dehydrogenase n=1 Tax=Sporothrix bragantina TaxID=671064 RepID=A0ABP0B6G2_9PEZI